MTFNWNWVDLIVLFFLIAATIKGMQRGIFREILSLFVLFAAYILAAWQYKTLAVSIGAAIHLPEKSIQVISLAISWLIIYSALEMVASIFKFLLPKLPLDPLVGIFLGFIRGATVVALIMLFLIVVPFPEKTGEYIKNSASVKWLYPAVAKSYTAVLNFVPGDFPKTPDLFEYGLTMAKTKEAKKIKTF